MSRKSKNSNVSAHVWDGPAIQAELKRKKISLASLERENGFTHRALHIAFQRPYLSAERVISKALGMPLHVLWADRWNPNGTRNLQPHNNNRLAANDDSQKAHAGSDMEDAA